MSPASPAGSLQPLSYLTTAWEFWRPGQSSLDCIQNDFDSSNNLCSRLLPPKAPSQKPSPSLGSALVTHPLFLSCHSVLKLTCPLVGEAGPCPAHLAYSNQACALTPALWCAAALVTAILLLGPKAHWIRCTCFSASLPSHHSAHCFRSFRLFPHKQVATESGVKLLKLPKTEKPSFEMG